MIQSAPAQRHSIHLNHAIVEHYRALADRVRQMQSADGVQTIGITSCSPREGVTTVTANLAVVAASTYDRPVLVVDANLLRPAMRRTFGLRQGPGLADVLLHAVTPTEAICALNEPNLSLLCAGTAVACTRASFDPARISATFANLKRDYALILVDLPAATPTSPSWNFVGALDGTMLVVEAGHVEVDAAQQVTRRLTSMGAKTLGIVFNKQRQSLPTWLRR
jgi:Mrp family chromosome partitioning ATPase